MRIELYKLIKDPANFDLEKRLKAIINTDIESRNRQRNNDWLRLEAHHQAGNLWFCDFVKLRMHHGPSRAGLTEPCKGFDLQNDEGFGEETAFLWDASNDWCVIQYNHYGVRPGAVTEYLGLFVHDAPAILELAPKLDEHIHAKIKSKKIVTRFTLSVAPKQLSDADFDVGGGLGDAAKALKQADADRVEITISGKKQHGGLDLKLPDLFRWAKKLGGGHEGSPLSVAKATARDGNGSESEVLDLLHHRITTEEDLTPGPDKRYSLKERWDALLRAHHNWRSLMT